MFALSHRRQNTRLSRRGHRRAALALALIFLGLAPGGGRAAPPPLSQPPHDWSIDLDGRVRFYQLTELGVIVAGTEKALYGVDAVTGEVLWRRRTKRPTETHIAFVPGTDLLLVGAEEDDDKTRLAALDLVTGSVLWQSEKVRGAVMQLAVDLDARRLAVILVRDAQGRARDGVKRRPAVHLLDLATGEEAWAEKLNNEVEMMPAGWDDDDEARKVAHTLDNYRPPLFLDDRLYLFYEGVTVLAARTGKELRREKFRVNEENLALTEADPVSDEQHVFVSGRGRLRAISRATGDVVWEAKDLGLTPEMALAEGVLYVRTGGQFTRLRDGETVTRGPFGVSAIDAASGKVLWRYKGADKGITNIASPDQTTLLIADRDDLTMIDAQTGRRRGRIAHRVEGAQFILINERGAPIVGGRDQIAAFDVARGEAVWRARHEPPARGLLRTIAAITTRAASLYFRYGGAATTIFRGAQLGRAVGALRWSGLAARARIPNLTSLATAAAGEYVTTRFAPFGVAARARPDSVVSAGRLPRRPSRPEVGARLFDQLDPASQLERLSRFLWHRRRLTGVRGEWMYFYTDLKDRGGAGLVGVNINTGVAERSIPISNPDSRFISDEAARLLYIARDDKLLAYPLTHSRD